MKILTNMMIMCTTLIYGGLVLAQDMASPPNALTIDDIGKIGIGTDMANTRFEVIGDDGTSTRVRIQETNATAKIRSLLSIVNNGPPSLSMQDKSPTGKNWNIRGSTVGQFGISEIGSGVVEMSLGVGTAGVTFAGPVMSASSRKVKKDFEQIDSQEILNKLEKLPISKWRYKNETVDIQHLGPTAEDFSEVFGLGKNNSTIASVDSAGVALAAVKALHHIVKEKNSRIAELEQRLTQLDEQRLRVMELEQVVLKLISDQQRDSLQQVKH